MKILVVGAGGREHALCWHLARSASVPRLYCAPGNPGTAGVAENVPIRADDQERLATFARREAIDLTVVGPEAPLCAGLQDRFAAEGLAVAGPSAAAARLEGSKTYAKQFMARHGIPTAPFGIFDARDPDAALRYIEQHPEALVVKADGLASGKGVFVCRDALAAKEHTRQLLAGSLGIAGQRIVVEHRLHGEEVSFIVLTDGTRICPLVSSQDHKAALDGDQGPNTGGMGACSPAPVLDEALRSRVLAEIVEPTVQGLAAEGVPYRGILYVGLMIIDGQPHVLEFNCRLGDPEAQPLLLRLDDDLLPYLAGMAHGELPEQPLRWSSSAALCVVMAAQGYPGAYRTGRRIEGLAEANAMPGVTVFQAGTAWQGGELVVAGGRVLGVTALGEGIRAAQRRAYAAVERIHWDGVHYRHDIGERSLSREAARGVASA